MKTLVISNQKGGVGKSTLACQFAFFLSLEGKRVVVVDTDHQANSTKTISSSGKAVVSKTTSDHLFTAQIKDMETASFVLIPSAPALKSLEKKGDEHNIYATNLRAFIRAVSDQFDYCVIDTNPSPDIRVKASLVSADFIVAPVQLNQEAVDGIGALIRDVNAIKTHLNPSLDLIGILPNQVERTPFQKENFGHLVHNYASLLILLADNDTKFALIPHRSALAEAQAAGMPLWELNKTAARDAWKEIKPAFVEIKNRMERNGYKHND
jgi:chromosome partitioning protein